MNNELCKCGKVGKISCPNDERCGPSTQLSAEYNPIGCEHKLANGLSAWMFQSERSGSGPKMNECVAYHVCCNCGEIRIAGYKWDGKSKHTDRFNEIIHICHPDAIDAIIKQANFFNEEAKWCRTDDYTALQAKCERYEAALKQIEQMSDPGTYWKAICDMKQVASEALSAGEGDRICSNCNNIFNADRHGYCRECGSDEYNNQKENQQ